MLFFKCISNPLDFTFEVTFQVESENLKDVLEELDQVENCSITNRSATVLSTTTQICISKNGKTCSQINL